MIILSGVSRGVGARYVLSESGTTPIALGTVWETRGDSQTDGRETETTAISPMTCFEIIYNSSSLGSAPTVTRNGVSGCSLLETNARYTAAAPTNLTWAHYQESGNQNKTGQTTASEWGATFRAFMTEVATDNPSAVLSYETAYSFGPDREAEPYRDWDTYNTELDSSIATLAGSGINVVKVDTDTNIKALITSLGAGGYDTVCFPTTDPNAYHYQAPGNLMIALTMFDALGYNVSTLDLSGINVSASIKTDCLAVITG